MADEPGSITHFISALKAGEDDAVTEIWNRYATRLIGLARSRMRAANRRVADEEDAAMIAFDSFCRAAGDGRFEKLDDRADLWQILVLITVRKAVDLTKHEKRLRRGGGVVVSELVDDLVSVEQTPELAVAAIEQYESLLKELGDDQLRSIAIAKMEGYTNHEIAEQIGCTRQTVQRRLNVIRATWEEELD
ncbi:MAG: ECF-type sigma factor [Planctomycetaceae bacterium]